MMLFLIFATVWAALCFTLWRLMRAQQAIMKSRDERTLRAVVWRN